MVRVEVPEEVFNLVLNSAYQLNDREHATASEYFTPSLKEAVREAANKNRELIGEFHCAAERYEEDDDASDN